MKNEIIFKGVSSYGQVVSLFVRSELPLESKGTVAWPISVDESYNCELVDENGAFNELPYVTMLNRALPPDIRVLGWASVNGAFDSRFSWLKN